MSLFPFSFPSKAFRDNWGHFFWMSLVVITLSIYGGSIRLLPWFAGFETFFFFQHARRNHSEEPKHPILDHPYRVGVVVAGSLILGYFVAPSIIKSHEVITLPNGIILTCITLPLISASQIVSKNIHLLFHGELHKMWSDDYEERKKSIGSFWWDSFGLLMMLLMSRLVQLVSIAT